MDSTLLDTILNSGASQKISQKTGLSEDQINQIINTGLPMIVGGMAKNTSSTSGAASLDKALAKHSDSTVLESANDATHSAVLAEGTKILDHVFGSGAASTTNTVAVKTGTNTAAAGQVMAMLAPMVMAYLSKQKTSQGLDAGGIADILTSLTSGNNSSNSSGSILSSILQFIMNFFKKS
jgi:hypothetical protein